MNNIVKILFHLIPLIPLVLGYYYLAVAAVLLVVVAYVKVNKFTKKMEMLEEQGKKDSAAYSDLLKLKARWKLVTFLN